MKVLCSPQLDLFMFSELCVCFLHQWGCQCVEHNLLSWQQPGLFGDFHGTPLASNSTELDVTHYSYWNRLTVGNLVASDIQLGLSLPPSLFGDVIKIAFMCFRTFPLHWVSIAPLKCSSVLAVSPHSISFNPLPPLLK